MSIITSALLAGSIVIGEVVVLRVKRGEIGADVGVPGCVKSKPVFES